MKDLNSPGNPVAMLEVVLRRLALVDMVPFEGQAAPRVVGRSAAVRLAVLHRKQEAQTADLSVLTFLWSSLVHKSPP